MKANDIPGIKGWTDDEVLPDGAKIRFQHVYVHDTYNETATARPRLTFCYIRHDGKTYVGISVCSFDDNPVKAVGRDLSLMRAMFAIVTKEATGFIMQEGAVEVLDAASPYLLFIPTHNSFVVKKEDFMFLKA
jgi:hypothetical protein